MIADLRQHAGLACVVFTAAWLALALQPCMAAVQDSDAHPGHSDCPHCPSNAVPPCLDQANDCDIQDGLAKGERDAPEPSHLATVAYAGDAIVTEGHLTPETFWVEETGPPRHLLCCRFLE